VIFKLRPLKGTVKIHGKRTCFYYFVYSHHEEAQSEHKNKCCGTADENFFFRKR